MPADPPTSLQAPFRHPLPWWVPGHPEDVTALAQFSLCPEIPLGPSCSHIRCSHYPIFPYSLSAPGVWADGG